jgi:hypothetical protein
MPIVDFSYIPGTIKNPQQSDSSQAAWIDTDKVHFPDGNLTRIPAYEQLSYTEAPNGFNGICRGQYASRLTSNDGVYQFFGTNSHLYVIFRGVQTNITPLKTSATATLGSDPVATTNTSNDLTITYTAHSFAVGDRIKLTGSTAVNGVPADEINAEHIVQTTPTANTFTVTVQTAATSTGSGGGAAIDVFTQIDGGNENQQLGAGYGTGIYGSGIYGAPRFSGGAQIYPRIWSFADFGNEIVMCPGDYTTGDGQRIYVWDGDTAVAPTVLANSPSDCNWVLVSNNSVIALCGSTIKISESGNGTVWSGFTYTQFDVQRAWRLISGINTDEDQVIVFAPRALLLRLVGGEWDLIEFDGNYAISSPQAVSTYRDGVIWYGDNGLYFYYDGGAVRTINNEQNGEFVRDNYNYGKVWHSFMFEDPQHDQVWHFYPSGQDTNSGNYVIINIRDSISFTLGTEQRNSAQKPEMIQRQFYMTDNTSIWSHFIIDDSSTEIPWTAKSAYTYIGDGFLRAQVNNIYPDLFVNDSLTLNIKGRDYPQSEEVDFGNYTINAAQRNIYTRAAGRLTSYAFSGTKEFTLLGMKLDVVGRGTRL